MAVGSVLKAKNISPLKRFIVGLLGTSDIHSHFRLKPLLDHLRSLDRSPRDVLELGCGDGVVLMEALDCVEIRTALGIDLDHSSIARANELLRATGSTTSVKFQVKNISDFNSENKYDVILLIDVMEHLINTEILMSYIRNHLRSDGILIVSVPTPLYPRVFGKAFHQDVGHVRDGYNLEQLTSACADFEVVKYSYNTGPAGIILCYLYYRLAVRLPRQLRAAIGFAMVPLTVFDFWHPHWGSCSLFAVFSHKSPQP